MGSILSAIADDEDHYEYLCRKYLQIPQKLYSDHHDWLEDKNNGRTNLSYDEYQKIEEEKRIVRRIELLEEEIKAKQEEVIKLKQL